MQIIEEIKQQLAAGDLSPVRGHILGASAPNGELFSLSVGAKIIGGKLESSYIHKDIGSDLITVLLRFRGDRHYESLKLDFSLTSEGKRVEGFAVVGIEATRSPAGGWNLETKIVDQNTLLHTSNQARQ